jgi:hypothetical protein
MNTDAKTLSACCGAAVIAWSIDDAFCDDSGFTCGACQKAADTVETTPGGALSLVACWVCWDARPASLITFHHSVNVTETLCGPCLSRRPRHHRLLGCRRNEHGRWIVSHNQCVPDDQWSDAAEAAQAAFDNPQQ